jgi:glutamate:Na+ symporter, ESS family
MNFSWTFFIDIGAISLALLISTLIRGKVRFFQKYLIPNALTAGFLLLFFYNFVAPRLGLDGSSLGELVYHLLSISFIAMTLRKTPARKRSDSIFATSVGVLSQYALQATIGLLVTFLLIKTLFPNLFPAFGWLLPLGFVLGPGQAYAIGQGWESFGFEGAGTIGLTFAAVGFLWACFGGVFLINYGIRKGWVSTTEISFLRRKGARTGIYPKSGELPVGARLTTESEAIDSMSFNIALVFGTYLITYLFLKFMTFLLSLAGDLGAELATNLWGIGFVFAAITAIIVKRIMRKLGIDFVADNGSLTRISGTAVDVMVSASIGAISLVVVAQYWAPILILCSLGGLVTIVTVPWISSRLFKDHRFQRMLIVYGASTGTMPTGLALLRVIDPYFETPAASDFMYSTGYTFLLAIPFIMAINLPAYSVTSGKPIYFWLAVAVSLGYALFVFIAYKIISKRRATQNPRTLWLEHLDEHSA